MEQEQVDLIIRAAKVLQDKKEIFDYLIVILPVTTAFIGWFASIRWQSHMFTKNIKKEHYYKASEKVESIVESFSNFLEYVYTFYKNTKNDMNQRQPLAEDTLTDFITEYQFMLGHILQKLKIIFPGTNITTTKVASEMKFLEANIKEMNGVINDLHRPNPDMVSIKTRIEGLNKRNLVTITNVANEVSMIENKIISILNNKAIKLNIKELE